MKIPGKNKAKKAGIRLSVPLLIVLLVLIASVLIIYSTPVLTEEKRTSGNLTFTDSVGIPISGNIEISMTGAPSGGRSNVNSIKWSNAPNAWIYFDAIGTKSISINLRIAEDSPNGRVSLEDYGAAMPGGVGEPAPSMPVKYVELRSTGVSFSNADVSIHYIDAELNGLDEKSLVIYSYDGGAWTELPTRVDVAKNIVSAAVDTLSVFAISARANEEALKKDRELVIPHDAKEIIESDALKTKGVAVKLKINKRGDGQIKLEDYGKKNPVDVAPPGNAIKFVDISAENISFESAEVRIQYTDEELGGADESALIIYHWNGVEWDALATSVDAANNILTATTASLSPFAVSGGTGGTNKILVATDRYVVLDDPIATGGTAGTGYYLPDSGEWGDSNDRWTGRKTTIGAKALFIDGNGIPIQGQTVTFRLFYPSPSNAQYATGTGTTDSSGVASFYRDLSGVKYYGAWKVRAESGSVYSSNTTFIYNWWGCAWATSGRCGNQHRGKDPADSGTATANSPYTLPLSWEKITIKKTQHNTGISTCNWADDYCTVCHQSYDGNPTTSNVEGSTTKDFTPPDTHRNIRCDNSSCHNPGTNFANHNAGTITIGSCTSASCHPLRTDISMKSTLNGVVSNYSNTTVATGTYDKYHTPNSTVPCIICHGPMHNISKPDQTQNFTRNTNTEDTHCTTCHSNYQKHNQSNTSSGGVNCTLCHSDDVHYIQVFAQNGTYITLNKSNPNPARGNCTSCHQNSTFLNTLKNTTINPRAGIYTGRNPPQVAAPVRHSNDANAGKKWNQTSWYWTYIDQLTWCKYCHGETNHKEVALGRPSMWRGNNTVNSTIGNTTWCVGCHWQLYRNGTKSYQDMVNNFTDDNRNITPSTGYNLSIAPEISGNSTYTNTSNWEYTNHSLYTPFSTNLNDSACNRCHGYNYGFTRITQLMHNQSRVGGPNCVECHDIGGIALVARVNVTATNDNNQIHKNLNSGAGASNGTAYYANNKRCWACHGNGNEPSTNAHPSIYKTPFRCEDCHKNHSTNLSCTVCHFNIPINLDEHYQNGVNIKTPAATTCYICHSKSEMLISANDPDNGSGAVYGGANGGNNSPSHYGKKRTDLRIGASANCSYCHQNTSTAFASAMIDPAYNSSISNHSMRYSSSNPGCTSSQCHNTGWIHNDTLAKPSLTLPSSAYCSNCHGSGGSANIKNLAKHNGAVDCTRCHLNTSRDIHPARYLQSNASYSISNSTAVNCINCHQTGLTGFSNSPMVPMPLRHSENTSNGTLWNSTSYWTPASPLTSCIYCHNDTKHNATALGRPANWKGNNIVNSSLSTGTWCASCHYRNYSSGGKNYSDMTWAFTSANLPVPPEITNGSYAVNIYNRSNYYNHSLKNYSDAVCILCHGANLSSTSGVSAFLHNISWGSCTSCHYSFEAMNNTTRPDRYVDFSMYNTSLHRSLSCTNCHTQGHRNMGARKACEDCHAVQANPITDKDRHNITATPSTYFVGGNNVVGITVCTTCHNSTLYNRSISTYGYWKPKDCDYCHTYPDKYYE